MILVEVLRGDHVESRHAGAFVVADADGRVVLQGGDVAQAVFPRSAIKAFQALPLIETGAAERFGLDDEALALACASHDGSPEQVRGVERMLASAGLSGTCLECGVQWPSNGGAARALAAEGRVATALHNNCSGKHAGFLCVAAATGAPLAGYVAAEHPVMQRVTRAVAEVTGASLEAGNQATDGCSIPTYAIPLTALARGFARFGSGQGLGATRAAAAARLRRAVAAHPERVAGGKRFDTLLMQALGERAFVKVGAEGVHCGALPELGLGFAVKCADGASRASEVVTAALVQRLLNVELDSSLTRPELLNWNGLSVGSLRPAPSLLN